MYIYIQNHKRNRQLGNPLQIFGPLIAFHNPLLQLHRIPRLKAHLEWLGLRRQSRRDLIALQCIQDRPIRQIAGRVHGECGDQPNVSREELAVGQMRTGTHARTSAVAIVRRARTLTDIQIALRNELFRHLEMVFVVVGGPGVLMGLAVA